MQIVPVDRENFESLLPLVEGYQRFYKVKDIDGERNRRFFSRFLDHPEEGAQFLARLDDEAVGFCTLYFPYSSTQAAAFALMNDLFVLASARGQGVGRALIEQARDEAAGRGFPRLCWMTAEDNVIAQRLYDSFPVEYAVWREYTLATCKPD